MAAHVAVYKIEADEFACKEHNMQNTLFTAV